MRILIAAGGTGGHIYPALAVVTRLRGRLPDVELRWLGGRRGLEADIVPARGLRLDRLWLRSLRTVDASLNTILDPLRLAASVPQAFFKLRRWRPDVIYTTGGYVAIPVLAAATALRIPSLLWEGNRSRAAACRLSARLASAIAPSASRPRATPARPHAGHGHAHPSAGRRGRGCGPRAPRAAGRRAGAAGLRWLAGGTTAERPSPMPRRPRRSGRSSHHRTGAGA